MPRKKKEPVKSGDLTEQGESILTGIAYDPFEPKEIDLAGLVTGYASLKDLVDPESLDNGLLVLANRETAAVRYGLSLVTSHRLANAQLQTETGRHVPMVRSTSHWSLGVALAPGEVLRTNLWITYRGRAQITGKLVIKGMFL